MKLTVTLVTRIRDSPLQQFMSIVRTLRIKSEDLKYKRLVKGVLLSKKLLQCTPTFNNEQEWRPLFTICVWCFGMVT